MAIWKIEAQGDAVYTEAESSSEAKQQFQKAFGDVPASLLTFTEVDELPDGEELI